MQERRRAHVAHHAALSTIKKSGKERHARVDNATPRVLQFAHIRDEGLERRRRKEAEKRHAEDPWIRHRLRQAAQVGSSGLRPDDDGGGYDEEEDLERLLGPSAEWEAAAEAALHGGGGGGGAHNYYADDTTKIKTRSIRETRDELEP